MNSINMIRAGFTCVLALAASYLPAPAFAASKEEAMALSELWARRSEDFLERGLRDEAVGAALKGVPVGAGGAPRQDFELAYSALVRAYFARRVQLPDLEGVNSGSLSADRRLALLRRSVKAGSEYRETVELWSTAASSKLATLADFQVKDSSYSPVSISSDGAYATAHLTKGVIKVWRTSDYSEVASFDYKTQFIWLLYFSPRSNYLIVSPGNDSKPLVWSTREEKVVFDTRKNFITLGNIKAGSGNSLLIDADDEGNVCLQAYKSTKKENVYDVRIAALSIDPAKTFAGISYLSNNPYWLICGLQHNVIASWTFSPHDQSSSVRTFDPSTGRAMMDEVLFEQSEFSNVLYLDPTSGQIAVLTGEKVSYIDAATGEETRPEIPQSYTPVQPGIYDTSGKAAVPVDYAVDDLWPASPSGKTLEQRALSELPAPIAQDVTEKRISISAE